MKAKRINVTNILYYLAYIFFAAFAFLGTIPSLSELFKSLTYVGILCIIFIFIKDFKTYTVRDLFTTFILTCLSCIVAMVSGNLIFLKLVLFLVLAKNIPFRKRVSFDLLVRVMSVVIMITLCQAGLTEDIIYWYKDSVRHSLGFDNPNVLGMHMLIACLEYLYIINKNFKLYKLLPLIISIVTINMYSASRASFIISIAAIIMYVVWHYCKAVYSFRIIKAIITNSVVWVTILAIIMFTLFNCGSEVMNNVNEFLSGRLNATSYYSSMYSINLFGNELDISNMAFDMAPFYVLYSTGIVGFLLYIVGFNKLLKVSYKQDIPLAIMLFSLVLYSISERLWLSADCNILVTALTMVVYSRKEEK